MKYLKERHELVRYKITRALVRSYLKGLLVKIYHWIIPHIYTYVPRALLLKENFILYSAVFFPYVDFLSPNNFIKIILHGAKIYRCDFLLLNYAHI